MTTLLLIVALLAVFSFLGNGIVHIVEMLNR